MIEETYYLTDRAVIIKTVKYNYKKDIEGLRKQGKNKYRELSEEEKNTKREYWRNRYLNASKKRKKKQKNIKKDNIVRLRSLNLVVNKVAF